LLNSKLEFFFDILSSFGVDSAHIFSRHLVSMSDDSSRPASGAVSLWGAFAAQCSWGSFLQAWHGSVRELLGVTRLWPTDRSHASRSQALLPAMRIHWFPLREMLAERISPLSIPGKSRRCIPAGGFEGLAEE